MKIPGIAPAPTKAELAGLRLPDDAVVVAADGSKTLDATKVTNAPLLVFINRKSGAQKGSNLADALAEYLSVHQILDLADGGPAAGLALFAPLEQFRVLACGGDGTVGWVLGAMEAVEFKCEPHVAILPMGTGNDLARSLGWGGGYSGGSIAKVLAAVQDARVVRLDRWDLRILKKGGGGEVLREVTFQNYMSVGADAKITLDFHLKRESHPNYFKSRLGNKAWYGALGSKAVTESQYRRLQDQLRVTVDDVEARLPSSQGLVLLNLDSYMSGIDMWTKRKGKGRFVPQSYSDGLLEVMTHRGAMHLGYIQSHIASANRFAQASEIRIEMLGDAPMAVQVDGEPWLQEPCVMVIKPRSQAAMLARASAVVDVDEGAAGGDGDGDGDGGSGSDDDGGDGDGDAAESDATDVDLPTSQMEAELKALYLGKSGYRQSFTDAPTRWPGLLERLEQHDLGAVATAFRRNMGVRLRRYHKRNYENVFVGSDAVDLLVSMLHLSTRHEAVEIGQCMLQWGMFAHVVDAHPFKDAFLFYRFSAENIEATPKQTITDAEGNEIDLEFSSEAGATRPVITKPFFALLSVKCYEVRNVPDLGHGHRGPFKLAYACDGVDYVTRKSQKCTVEDGVLNPQFNSEKAHLVVAHSKAWLGLTLTGRRHGKKDERLGELNIHVDTLELGKKRKAWFTLKPLASTVGTPQQDAMAVHLSIKYEMLQGRDGGNFLNPYLYTNRWARINVERELPPKTAEHEAKVPGAPNHRLGFSDVYVVPENDGVEPARKSIHGVMEYGMFSLAHQKAICFLQDNESYASEWRLAGKGTTFNGLVEFPIPDDCLRTVGRYPMRMYAVADRTTAEGSAFVVAPGTKCVVFDIDGTLTVGDEEVIKTAVLDAATIKYNPKERRGAQATVRYWYAKGYFIVYLSGRAGAYVNLTKNWLVKKRFPPGIIGHTSTHMPTLPIYGSGIGVGVFKEKYMRMLQEQFAMEVYAGYGNTGNDIKAYNIIGVPKERTFIVGPNSGHQGTVDVGKTYQGHTSAIARHPDGVPRAPTNGIDWH